MLISKVKEHAGLCKPVWLNKNEFLRRLDGGITGFFKNVKPVKILFFTIYKKYGKEFHRIIVNSQLNCVYSTEGLANGSKVKTTP